MAVTLAILPPSWVPGKRSAIYTVCSCSSSAAVFVGCRMPARKLTPADENAASAALVKLVKAKLEKKAPAHLEETGKVIKEKILKETEALKPKLIEAAKTAQAAIEKAAAPRAHGT